MSSGTVFLSNVADETADVMLSKKQKQKQKQKKKKAKNNSNQNNNDLYLLKIGLLLTVGIGIAIGVLLFQPIFIFGLVFFLAFLFFLAGLTFSMGLILSLSRAAGNYREKNEEMAGYILMYMITRIILLSIVFLMVPTIYGIILTVTFLPGFMVQLLIMTLLLKSDISGNDRKNMFRTQTEPSVEQ
jgi:cation transport ATPase